MVTYFAYSVKNKSWHYATLHNLNMYLATCPIIQALLLTFVPSYIYTGKLASIVDHMHVLTQITYWV